MSKKKRPAASAPAEHTTLLVRMTAILFICFCTYAAFFSTMGYLCSRSWPSTFRIVVILAVHVIIAVCAVILISAAWFFPDPNFFKRYLPTLHRDDLSMGMAVVHSVSIVLMTLFLPVLYALTMKFFSVWNSRTTMLWVCALALFIVCFLSLYVILVSKEDDPAAEDSWEKKHSIPLSTIRIWSLLLFSTVMVAYLFMSFWVFPKIPEPYLLWTQRDVFLSSTGAPMPERLFAYFHAATGNKLTESNFWVGFIFTTLGLPIQAAVYFTLFQHNKTPMKKFYVFPQFRWGVRFLIAQAVVGALLMLFPRTIPAEIAWASELFVAGAAVVLCVLNDITRTLIVKQEENLEKDINHMQRIREVAVLLPRLAEDPELKAQLEELVDIIQSSDPVGTKKTVGVEKATLKTILELQKSIVLFLNDPQSHITRTDLLTLARDVRFRLEQRNRICKASK